MYRVVFDPLLPHVILFYYAGFWGYNARQTNGCSGKSCDESKGISKKYCWFSLPQVKSKILQLLLQDFPECPLFPLLDFAVDDIVH